MLRFLGHPGLLASEWHTVGAHQEPSSTPVSLCARLTPVMDQLVVKFTGNKCSTPSKCSLSVPEAQITSLTSTLSFSPNFSPQLCQHLMEKERCLGTSLPFQHIWQKHMNQFQLIKHFVFFKKLCVIIQIKTTRMQVHSERIKAAKLHPNYHVSSYYGCLNLKPLCLAKFLQVWDIHIKFTVW